MAVSESGYHLLDMLSQFKDALFAFNYIYHIHNL